MGTRAEETVMSSADDAARATAGALPLGPGRQIAVGGRSVLTAFYENSALPPVDLDAVRQLCGGRDATWWGTWRVGGRLWWSLIGPGDAVVVGSVDAGPTALATALDRRRAAGSKTASAALGARNVDGVARRRARRRRRRRRLPPLLATTRGVGGSANVADRGASARDRRYPRGVARRRRRRPRRRDATPSSCPQALLLRPRTLAGHAGAVPGPSPR